MPSQAQIEAAIKAIDDYYDGTKDAPFEGSVRAALTAAAQAGEQSLDIWNTGYRAGEDATIERCAQVAESFPHTGDPWASQSKIAAAIRKLKEQGNVSTSIPT